ncbi:MAG: sigma-54-dependent transcriptional regulator [Kordiimonas sp.]
MKQNILIVDDDTGVLSALNMLLKSEGFIPVIAQSPEQAITAIQKQNISLVLMDLNYSQDTTSGEEGLQLVHSLRQIDEAVPIVVMTGWGTIEVAVDIMKNGANDFLQKPWENDRLLAILRNQTELACSQKVSERLSRQNQLLREESDLNNELIVESNVMQDIIGTLNQVANSDVSVLLTGENGTGKSLFARYIHDHSPRKNAAQVSVNMGAVTEALFESEMFGHVKGAFTDAKSNRIGRFELADEGTLFLDEIANTPYSQQAKLLRVLEDRQFEKVGSSKTQVVDIRLVTATNSDLNKAVEQGQFRKDLLYRLNTIQIEIPPLRKRSADIIPLAKAFLKKVAVKYSKPALEISSQAETALLNYPWPGNVRELGHVMERAQILCQSDMISLQDLGLNTQITKSQVAPEQTSTFTNTQKTLDEIEAIAIEARFNHFAGDAMKAANSLGLSRSAFYRKLQKAKN